MTLTVDVSKELEEKLEREAANSGVSKNEFVRIVLEEKLDLKPEKRRLPPFEAKIIAADLPVRDRSREYEWLEKHCDEYDGKYVALKGDRLVAVSETGKDLAAKIRESGESETLIIFVEGSSRPRFISGGIW